MKKKLLTLVLAATMMVGTAVTASATSQTVDFTAASGSTTSDVVIDGTIVKGNGSAPAGKIQVEVPTQMAFLVDKTGTIASTSYTVENKSDSPINVSVANFKKRNTVNSKINLLSKDESNMENKDRSNIKLYLVGDSASKIVDLGDFSNTVNKDLATIAANSMTTITLEGDAGKDTSGSKDIDQNGASEQFDMVFKIAKVG